MKWGELINQLWASLKIELSNNGINSIEVFMNFIFIDIFKFLNENKNIKEYQEFIKLEKKLNIMINDKIELFKKNYKADIQSGEICDEKNEHFISYLLKEKYNDLDNEDFPFYQRFFYTDYLDENYLLEKLNLMNKEKYPVTLRALEQRNNGNTYSLTKLEKFNKTLNILNEEYLYKITRVEAEKKILANEKIYKSDPNKFKDFFNLYNDFKKKSDTKKLLKLDEKKELINFFVDENTDIGKSYKEIYEEFIKRQNSELLPLLKLKIEKEIFEKSCLQKINIQNINEDEIFTLQLPQNFSFIEIAFNHSYRKILIDNDFKTYNNFIIEWESIEETMTDLLLNKKKLLKDKILYFVYANEDLNFENKEIITTFNNNPKYQMETIQLNDKIILYQFYENHYEDPNILKQIINDFIQLIIFLNNNRDNEKISDKILGKNEIYKVFSEMKDIKISEDFKSLFEQQKDLTINKTTNLFIFYLKLIFDKIIREEFTEFQGIIEESKKTKIVKYFDNKSKNNLIQKNTFKNAIILLITLYLDQVKNKESKIKENKNNISNYLNIKDIWVNINTDKKEFKSELAEIKKLKIQINQILCIYNLLEDKNNQEEDEYDDIIREIEKRNKEENPPTDDEKIDEEQENVEEEKEEDENQEEVEGETKEELIEEEEDRD